MRWLPLTLLVLASCLAQKVSGDAGLDGGNVATAACNAAGGECVAPTDCAEQVGSVNCGAGGDICCAPVQTVTTTVATDATTAPSDASTPATDANSAATKIAPGCSTSCETTCEGDPICIQNCGC